MLNLAADRRPPSRLVIAAVGGILLSASLSLAALSSSAAAPVAVPEAAAAPPPVVAAAAPAIVQPARAAVGATRRPQPQAPGTAAPATPYKGELITLDLKQVDLKEFFRLIGEVGRLNVVVDPDVSGTVTVMLKDIPWDQALDIVVRDRKLGMQLQGNVLRVSSKPAGIVQGRIVLDFEVLKNGMLLGKPRMATVEKVAATLSQGTDYTISVTPIKVGANSAELNFEFAVGAEKFSGRGLVVSRDSPGKVLWKTARDSYEITVTLAPAP